MPKTYHLHAIAHVNYPTQAVCSASTIFPGKENVLRMFVKETDLLLIKER